MITQVEIFSSKKHKGKTGGWVSIEQIPEGGKNVGHTYHACIYNAKTSFAPRAEEGLKFMKEIQESEGLRNEFTWREKVLKHAFKNPFTPEEEEFVPKSDRAPYGTFHRAMVGEKEYLPEQVKAVYGIDMASDEPEYSFNHYKVGMDDFDVGAFESTTIEFKTYSEKSPIVIYRLIEGQENLKVYRENSFNYQDLKFKRNRNYFWLMCSDELEADIDEVCQAFEQIIDIYGTTDLKKANKLVEKILTRDLAHDDDVTYILGLDLEYIHELYSSE